MKALPSLLAISLLAAAYSLAPPARAETQAESADFTLDTRGSDIGLPGILQADSADFTLDTRGSDTGLPGVSQGDSPDFTLHTTGSDTGLPGVSQGDSRDFTLDTRGPDTGLAGVSQGDSADFTLDTRGSGAGLAGVSQADSADFTLDTTDGPPVITAQPQSQMAQFGQNATLSVSVTGQTPLYYRWMFNGGVLEGATNSSITRAPVRAAHAGPYQVIITNFLGRATSDVATLTVLPAPIKTWVGPANGSWFVATNWSPTGVPGLYDTIIVTNGWINLTAPVTIGGQFTWSGGTLFSNALTIAPGGTLNISNSVTLGNALTNAGTVNWWAGAIYLYAAYGNPGPVVNEASGLWNIQCNDNQSLYPYSPYGPNFYFLNQGAVQRSPATWAAHIALSFTNTGVVTSQGPLYFEAGGALGGSFQAAASGAVIAFNGGNFTGAGALMSGPGVVRFSGGNLLLPTNVIPNLALTGGTVSLGSAFQGGSITNLTVAGSTLSGTNTLTGTFNWNGGALSGPLAVMPAGLLNISNDVTVGSALTNAGTVNWLAGQIYLNNGIYPGAGPLVNLAGGVWTIQCDYQSIVSYDYSGTNLYFVNAGLVQKTVGTTYTYIYPRFYNTGTLSLLSGRINFALANGYTQTGATFNFGLAGAGRPAPLQVSGALSLDGTLSASLTNYTPRLGDNIPLISCSTLANSFNCLDLSSAGNNLGWRVVYAPSGVSLQVISNGAYTAQITGTVTETGGAPVANLSVFAYATNAGNSLFLSTVTSGSGTYALNVTNGAWRVGLQGLAARGYGEVPTQNVVVNGTNLMVNFVVQRLGGVALGCERFGRYLLLSWPATATNCVLEATPSLRPTAWAPAPEQPVLQGNLWVVMVEISGNSRFFRLRQGGVGPVSLSITRSNSLLVLSWPLSAAGWLLQTTTNLTAGTVWTELPPPYQTNGTSFQFTEPLPLSRKFYRLHHL